MFKRMYSYLNPIAHLGDKKYPYWLSVVLSLIAAVSIEFTAVYLLHRPNDVGLPAIFIFVTLILYTAFRSGIIGGVITVIMTVSYYFYIIYYHHYTGDQLTSGIISTIILGFVYFLLASIIGWLKQTIDELIDQEANERRRLETIIEQLPVGVVITDEKGKVVQSNKRFDTILGMRFPLGHVVGKQEAVVKSLIDGKEITNSQSPLYQSITTGRVIKKEVTIERPDGKTVYTQVSASPIHNRQGKIVAAASIITDITSQKEMEKRKDDFVNMASHELKTPITSMKLYIDSLRIKTKDSTDEKIIKIVNSLKNQTERLQELVNDLLDVSRIQTGKLSFTKDVFRLDEQLTETVEELQGAADNRLVLRKAPATLVTADKFRIYQVITNLITNAIKYSAGTGEITIRLTRTKDDVTVSVRDNGIGISRDQQKKVFERLYQVTDDKEKTFPGFGMGLYISKEIVTRHQGKIWVESEKGKGSTFFFTLPRK